MKKETKLLIALIQVKSDHTNCDFSSVFIFFTYKFEKIGFLQYESMDSIRIFIPVDEAPLMS